LPEPDELTLTIARHLEIDNQYVEFIGACDIHRIAEVRSAGRKAGRLLDWKIMAYQTSPNDEGRLAVIVAVREWPYEEREQRMAERVKLLLDEFWSLMFLRKKRSDSPEWRVRQT
jgi:hypothetical protein